MTTTSQYLLAGVAVFGTHFLHVLRLCDLMFLRLLLSRLVFLTRHRVPLVRLPDKVIVGWAVSHLSILLPPMLIRPDVKPILRVLPREFFIGCLDAEIVAISVVVLGALDVSGVHSWRNGRKSAVVRGGLGACGGVVHAGGLNKQIIDDRAELFMLVKLFENLLRHVEF